MVACQIDTGEHDIVIEQHLDTFINGGGIAAIKRHRQIPHAPVT
jgi:hypothetical protein